MLLHSGLVQTSSRGRGVREDQSQRATNNPPLINSSANPTFSTELSVTKLTSMSLPLDLYSADDVREFRLPHRLFGVNLLEDSEGPSWRDR